MSPLMNVVLNLPTATEFQSIADRLARLHDLEQQPIHKEQLVTGPVIAPWQPTNDHCALFRASVYPGAVRCRHGGRCAAPTNVRSVATAVKMSICGGCHKKFTRSGYGLFPSCDDCHWEGSVCIPRTK
jgi:hypothetical protein